MSTLTHALHAPPPKEDSWLSAITRLTTHVFLRFDVFDLVICKHRIEHGHTAHDTECAYWNQGGEGGRGVTKQQSRIIPIKNVWKK